MSQVNILVVEDEQDILDLVEYNLQQEGFHVLRAMDGLAGIQLAKKERPDLVILDLMLPKMDGKEVCRSIRQDGETSTMPIMMLTARAEEIDRVIGFELGADDYLTKPFSPRELVLRVRAVLRRLKDKVTSNSLIRFPGILIDPEKHRVEIDEQDVRLTATEFRLLQCLAANSGNVLTREDLLDQVWGYVYDGYARTVDTHIRRLRKKMGNQQERIDTIRGVGYRFRSDQLQ
ncbi:MAG: response regulator transcription factor [Deltaproteobacteria bacterium]|nr:response regulator transcription factor [Deltaproteobacteria bacterium]MBF0523487.1 response regulator transcription factor [Deltaproteobacteria bacterium]